MKIRLELIEEMLGTSSGDPEIHREHIASKGPNASSIEEEVASLGVDNVERKSMSVFPRTEKGEVFIWDYQLKGFFKDACGALSRARGTESGKLTAYKKIIDGLIFVKPRKIIINPPKGQGRVVVGKCVRPLRIADQRGERVALASSETVPAGCSFDIEIQYFELKDKKTKKGDEPGEKADLLSVITELLDYGELRGLLQWRNSGKGRFIWKEIKKGKKK